MFEVGEKSPENRLAVSKNRMSFETPLQEKNMIMKSKLFCWVSVLAIWTFIFTFYYLTYFGDEGVRLKPRFEAVSLADNFSNKVSNSRAVSAIQLPFRHPGNRISDR